MVNIIYMAFLYLGGWITKREVVIIDIRISNIVYFKEVIVKHSCLAHVAFFKNDLSK